jgi:hypothetical protein
MQAQTIAITQTQETATNSFFDMERPFFPFLVGVCVEGLSAILLIAATCFPHIAQNFMSSDNSAWQLEHRFTLGISFPQYWQKELSLGTSIPHLKHFKSNTP